MSEYEIVKSEYNAFGEDNNYKTHYLKTSADQVVGLGRMKSFSYAVGDVVYTDNNMQVALKCTTAGTTSNTELDISNKVVGESVEDGTCVWSVVSRISDSVPIGQIAPFAMNEHPAGWLPCDGTAVSRIVYADLFAVIGTNFGAGDGSTTFNLPNLNNNSFIEGDDVVGIVKGAGLPNIEGSIRIRAMANNNDIVVNMGGAFPEDGDGIDGTSVYGQALQNISNSSTQAVNRRNYFDASRSNAIYGKSNTVQPKSVTVKFCIKAYGAITNAGSVELEEIAQDYEAIAQRTSVVEQTLPKKANLGALSMPSGNYMFISGNNDSQYVAPTDGYLVVHTNANGETYCYAYVMTNNVAHIAISTKAHSASITIPCAKGQTVHFGWNLLETQGNPEVFFTYAQSEV